MRRTLCLLTAAAAAIGFSASAQATLVTINMTADNIVNSGGVCNSATCQDGTGWPALTSASDWRLSDTITVDLAAGTHYFAWNVENTGTGGPTNPAGLLAEILWDGNANYSSSGWEVYNQTTGALIESATSYGNNGGANIWTNVLGGAVAGISTNAEWIYTSTNFTENTPASAWFRTSITIREVPEPGTLGLLSVALLGLGLVRRRRRDA